MKRHDALRRTLLALSVLPVLASSARHARAAAADTGGRDGAATLAGPAGGGDRAQAAAPAFEPDTFRRIVAAGAGRPLVVHLWGLTCAPCIEELPRWSEFVRRHAGANIVFVQVDPMPPERVAAVLRRAGLEHARNWSARAPMDERWRYRIDPDWAGELPRTLLIAADGRRAAISGRVGFERLRAWLGQG